MDRIVRAAALVAGIGCSSSTSSSSVSAIALSPTPCTVSRTNSVQMSAEATLPDGAKVDVTASPGASWSTGDSSTATVDSSGRVVGVNPGVTKVTLEYGGATGSTDCTVTP